MADSLIVEAGSAGCVLANRLSVDANTQVVVLEAGGSDRHVLYRMPGGYVGIIQRGQPGLNGHTMWCPRGKVLGGSSSINAQVFVRGNGGDFDD